MPLNDYGLNGALEREIEEIKLRLKVLETTPQANNTTLQNGALTVADDSGTSRTVLGQTGSNYGIDVHNADGVTVFSVNDVGITYPRMPLLLTKSNDNVVITAASFTGVWDLITPYVTGDAVQVQLVVAADAATAGEVRLTANSGAGQISAVQSVAASTANAYEWKWAIPSLVVGTGPLTVSVEARRTSGTGNIYVYAPIQMHMTTAASIGATATGV